MHLTRRSTLHGLVAMPTGALLGGTSLSGQRSVVHDGAELQQALTVAEPGAVITLAPGNFGDVGLFEVTKPGITLRAAWPHRAIIRAPMEITGERVTVADLAFHGDGADGLYLSALASCGGNLSIRSPDVEVRDCDFGFFVGRAILVRPAGLRPYIHDCDFHDNRMGNDRNANEAISLGYDNPTSHVSLRGRVIGNRLWNLNVESEAICVKTSDNLIQANQISSSKAGYSSRTGERNRFVGNVSTNAGGFVVHDRGNVLSDNVVNGSGRIYVMGGNMIAESLVTNNHAQAVETQVLRNQGALTIGKNYSGHKLPAVNTTVSGHSGSVELKNHLGTRITR